MGHRIQMELDSRKNEAKNDLKQMDIEIEVSYRASCCETPNSEIGCTALLRAYSTGIS